jgi:predicted nucleic acid-binding protein
MIVFDTAPVIWGIQGAARPEQRGMVGRTQRYLHYLARTDEQIVIPAPVIFEYLCGFDHAEQRRQRTALERAFRIPSFDGEAAAVPAELAHTRGLIGRVARQTGIDRQSLKVDFQIIAIAIVVGAELIVTHEVAAFQKMAQQRIKVIEVPDIPTQTEIPFPDS